MLKNIDPLLTPELLYVLALMGHGDELAIVDANFPAYSVARGTCHGRAISVAGASTPAVARAVLSVLPLDDRETTPLRVMSAPDGTPCEVHQEIQQLVKSVPGGTVALGGVERFAFYDASRLCFAIVQTGERRLYGNVLIKKGVVPTDGAA